MIWEAQPEYIYGTSVLYLYREGVVQMSTHGIPSWPTKLTDLNMERSRTNTPAWREYKLDVCISGIDLLLGLLWTERRVPRGRIPPRLPRGWVSVIWGMLVSGPTISYLEALQFPIILRQVYFHILHL